MAKTTKLTSDEMACFTEAAATAQEREAACARLGIHGMPTTPAGLGGPATPREVEVPKRGCRRAAWGGTKWNVQRRPERAGTRVQLGPGEVLVCGSPMKLKALAKALPTPALAVAMGRAAGLGADLQQVVIEIDIKDGVVRYKINGVKGPACTGVAKALTAALGLNVISDSPTAEYYEEPVSITTGTQVTVKPKYSL